MTVTRKGVLHGVCCFRATWRAAALIGVTACSAVVQAGALRLSPPLARRLPRWWHRMCCRLLAIDVRAHGTPKTAGPVLYVSNHASYLDVTVLGAALDARFVAKAEIARWPVVGALSRLQGTIFIERKQRGARRQPDALRRALQTGASLILFPEGTCSDGNRVLQFKTALFSAADAAVAGGEIQVQPITIAYSRDRGLPMGRGLRPHFAWYGDMTLVRHLWGCLGTGGAGVDVVFHAPVRLSQFDSRKSLACHCQTLISRGLSNALACRLTTSLASEARVAQPNFDLPNPLGFALLETTQEM